MQTRASLRIAASGLMVALGVALAVGAWAATGGDDQQASILTIQLYCDVRRLITGNVGVLIGLLLVFGGIWGIVQGKGIYSAVIAIIMGGLVTSLPSLVESFIQGTNKLLMQTGIAKTQYEPFNCSQSAEVNDSIQKCIGKRKLDVYSDTVGRDCYRSPGMYEGPSYGGPTGPR
jgi:hypothetical protein